VLVVGGTILGPNAIITRLPRPGEVTIENTERLEARVDGEPPRSVSADELRALLSEQPKRMLNLRLVNGRTEDEASPAVDFRIKIDVPTDAELDAVDEAFLRHLAREDPTRDDVMRFSDQTDGLANHYRDGLVSYVVGVFGKDNAASIEDARILERALGGQHEIRLSRRRIGKARSWRSTSRASSWERSPWRISVSTTSVNATGSPRSISRTHCSA
jgi:hypothetical protein